MAVLSGEVLKVDSLGAISVVSLEVYGSDGFLSSNRNGVEYVVDGVSLGSVSPNLFTGSMTYTTLEPGTSAISKLAISFTDGVNTYYSLLRNYDVNMVATFDSYSTSVSGAAVAAERYGIFDVDADIYRGDALLIEQIGGVVTDISVTDISVFDDDGSFEFVSGGEIGNDPVIFGPFMQKPPPLTEVSPRGTTDPGTVETLIILNYTTATGSGSFEAVTIIDNLLGSDYLYFIPKNGHVDLSEITGFVSMALTSEDVAGQKYSTFGLSSGRIQTTGNNSDNFLFGKSSPFIAAGEITNDLLRGYGGNDLIFGGTGADSMLGDDGRDKLWGGADNDILHGGNGRDTLYGGMDDDQLYGNAGRDTLRGGAGSDSLVGGNGADRLFGDRGDDTLKGNGGDDVLKGGDGADILRGATGNDLLNGGSGNDDLAGAAGADILVGGSGADSLRGGSGNDTLEGGAGRDTLNGQAGADVLEGGGGRDTFVFTADGETDTILDYADGTDLIDLDVDFTSLTITTVSAGTVEIIHSGETLIVQDGGAGVLVASDLTALDFI